MILMIITLSYIDRRNYLTQLFIMIYEHNLTSQRITISLINALFKVRYIGNIFRNIYYLPDLPKKVTRDR